MPENWPDRALKLGRAFGTGHKRDTSMLRTTRQAKTADFGCPLGSSPLTVGHLKAQQLAETITNIRIELTEFALNAS
jgi:hypothetical protein